MEDQSMLNRSSGADSQKGINEYANECIKEVCLKGDLLSKYQKQIEKKFGEAFYNKCDDFVKEVQRSIESKRFSNTSVINLKYLAKELGIPVETVDMITSHYSTIFISKPPVSSPDSPVPPDVPEKKGSGNSKWIIILLIAILGVGCYIAFNQNEKTSASTVEFYDNKESAYTTVDSPETEETSQSEESYVNSTPPPTPQKIRINMFGKIGNALESRCSMNYNQESDTGDFSYNIDGNTVRRKVKMGMYDISTNKLVLKEYSDNGDFVGEFSGDYTGSTYSGTFTNSRGVSIPFKLEQ